MAEKPRILWFFILRLQRDLLQEIRQGQAVHDHGSAMRIGRGKRAGQMDIQCRRADRKLTEKQLQAIAGLIYDTDPHIYPAMFKDRQEAETVIPRMIRSEDLMFRTDNLFIAVDGNEIVGVLMLFISLRIIINLFIWSFVK